MAAVRDKYQFGSQVFCQFPAVPERDVRVIVRMKDEKFLAIGPDSFPVKWLAYEEFIAIIILYRQNPDWGSHDKGSFYLKAASFQHAQQECAA
jgi:hypothetical protein